VFICKPLAIFFVPDMRHGRVLIVPNDGCADHVSLDVPVVASHAGAQ
jgi:hypothetical protein